MQKHTSEKCAVSKQSRSKGFTLIEILLAIGILAILATAVIIAINPARQFAEARDSQRWSDVHALMNAISQYAVGHKGTFPAGMPPGNDFQEICVTGASDCTGLYDLQVLTDGAVYLTAMPIDPSCGEGCDGSYGTGYFVARNADGRVAIQARNAEQGEIELVR